MKEKKLLGSKISEDKNIESQIIIWIQAEPDISDYEISKRLKIQFNIKISQPTVKKWRENFYKNKKKEIQKISDSVNIDDDISKFEVKHEQLNNLISLLDNLNERKDIIKQVLDSKNFTNKDGTIVPRIDTFIESIYKDYINSIIHLEDKILKYTSGANPFTISREVIERLTKYILLVFIQYKVSEEDINRYRDFIKEVDNEFYIKYNIDRKAIR